MKLREFISRQEGDALVKIGTEDGGGFLFAGAAGDFSPHRIDEGIRQSLRNRAYSKKFKSARKCVERAEKELREYKPIAGRTIIRVYASMLEPATIVIVKGKESGKRFLCDETPRPCVMETERGTQRLAAAIYACAANDLQKADKTYATQKTEFEVAEAECIRTFPQALAVCMFSAVGCETDLTDIPYLEASIRRRTAAEAVSMSEDKIRTLEEWFDYDEYGILSKGGIVDVIRKAAGNENTNIGV